MNASIESMYSIVDNADVAVNVEVPPGGISDILSAIHVVFPDVIFVIGARYILVVVTKYSDNTPLHSPC